MLLELDHIQTFIGEHHILHGVSLEVPEREVTVLLGRNGAGKTTTLRSIMGLNPPVQGEVRFQGKKINGLPPYEIARLGISFVPEDQGIFGDLTVEENLKVAMVKENASTKEKLEWTLNLFPDLEKFWKSKSGWLSGGQKQMLSIARALVQDCTLLLIDEPSKGLAPIVVEKVVSSLAEIKHRTTVVLVEQNFHMASQLGDRYYLVDDGQIVAHGKMEELKNDEQLKKKYLGIA